MATGETWRPGPRSGELLRKLQEDDYETSFPEYWEALKLAALVIEETPYSAGFGELDLNSVRRGGIRSDLRVETGFGPGDKVDSGQKYHAPIESKPGNSPAECYPKPLGAEAHGDHPYNIVKTVEVVYRLEGKAMPAHIILLYAGSDEPG